MAEKCKHGLDPRSCAPCQRANETEALQLTALRRSTAGSPVIVLRQSESETLVCLILAALSRTP